MSNTKQATSTSTNTIRGNEHPEYSELDLDAAGAGMWGPESLPASDLRGRALRLTRAVGYTLAAAALDVDAKAFCEFLERGLNAANAALGARVGANIDQAEEGHGIKNPKAKANINELVQNPAIREKLEALVEKYGPAWQLPMQAMLVGGMAHTELERTILAKGAKEITEAERHASSSATIAKFLPEEKKYFDSLEPGARAAFVRLSDDERHAEVLDPGMRRG